MACADVANTELQCVDGPSQSDQPLKKVKLDNSLECVPCSTQDVQYEILPSCSSSADINSNASVSGIKIHGNQVVDVDDEVKEISSTKNEDQFSYLNNDNNYFSCYADLSIHRVMIGDVTRTQTYRRAILSNYKLFHRKVVLDVGAGTGILSLFCAQAGAKRVYAIEASEVAKEAKKVVQSNGFSDRIIVIQQKVEDATLPEKVDIIVSEWMGYMLMYESMLPSLLFARDRWLKKGGWLFPELVRIYIAPLSDYQEYDYSVKFWKRVSDTYGIDMSALAKTAEEQMQASVHVMSVDPSCIQSHACCVAQMNLLTVDAAVTECTQGSFLCSCFGHTTVHGFVIWFTVHFPNNICLSTSPYENETHWEQSVLYIPPVHVQQSTELSGHLWIRRNSVYNRFLDIELEYEVDRCNKRRMRYKMND